MLFAKLSFAFLMDRVVPQSRTAKASFCAVLVIWSTFSCFAVAFRCSKTAEWAVRPGRCHGSGLLVASIVLNMLTDLILAGWLFPTLVNISLNKEKRVTAMVLFGSRAMCVPKSNLRRVLTVQSIPRGRSADLGCNSSIF
jgi:protein-S-isoprenylcysteine O-methyltransferase Ste14